MKKFFAIALALILLLSMVACSKDGDTEEEGGEATKVVENDVYTDEEGVDSFTYVVNERGSYDISGFSSTDIEPHKVEIPSTIDNIEVTGIAQDGFQALEFIEKTLPDVVLMDIRMPNMNGVVATQRIKAECPAVKVVILTTFDDSDYILNAINNGASGYLLKDIGWCKFFMIVHKYVGTGNHLSV